MEARRMPPPPMATFPRCTPRAAVLNEQRCVLLPNALEIHAAQGRGKISVELDSPVEARHPWPFGHPVAIPRRQLPYSCAVSSVARLSWRYTVERPRAARKVSTSFSKAPEHDPSWLGSRPPGCNFRGFWHVRG
jgi:hypothetical protein